MRPLVVTLRFALGSRFARIHFLSMETLECNVKDRGQV